MRRCGNHDLRFETEPQNSRGTERRMPERPTSDRDQLAAGYASLDQADTGPYSDKERRGLSRDANFPRRY